MSASKISNEDRQMHIALSESPPRLSSHPHLFPSGHSWSDPGLPQEGCWGRLGHCGWQAAAHLLWGPGTLTVSMNPHRLRGAKAPLVCTTANVTKPGLFGEYGQLEWSLSGTSILKPLGPQGSVVWGLQTYVSDRILEYPTWCFPGCPFISP